MILKEVKRQKVNRQNKGEVSNLTSPISSNIHNRRRLQAGCEPDPAPEDFTPCNPGQRIRRTTEDISG